MCGEMSHYTLPSLRLIEGWGLFLIYALYKNQALNPEAPNTIIGTAASLLAPPLPKVCFLCPTWVTSCSSMRKPLSTTPRTSIPTLPNFISSGWTSGGLEANKDHQGPPGQKNERDSEQTMASRKCCLSVCQLGWQELPPEIAGIPGVGCGALNPHVGIRHGILIGRWHGAGHRSLHHHVPWPNASDPPEAHVLQLRENEETLG